MTAALSRNRIPGPDSRRVQEMFAAIAHRYDFLNHFLSASIDRRWRQLAVAKVRELLGDSRPAPLSGFLLQEREILPSPFGAASIAR